MLNFNRKLLLYKSIISNFKYLTIIQSVNMLLPIIMYPFYLKTIGVSTLGYVIFLQSIVAIFSIFILYGFDVSAVKLVNESKSEKEEVEVFSGVMYVRLLLLTFCSLLFFILIIYNDRFSLKDGAFVFILVQFALYPTWYYQAKEDMKTIAFVNFGSKVVFCILCLLIIRDKSDYLYIAIFQSFTSILGGGLSLSLLLKKFPHIKFILLTPNKVLYYFISGFDIFYSNFFIALKDKCTIFIVGSLFSPVYVVLYDVGIKMHTLISIPIGMLNNSCFPRVVKEKDYSLFLKVFRICVLYSISSSMIMFTIIDYLPLSEYGIERENEIYLFVFLLFPITVSISQTIARNFLIAFGYRKEFMSSVTITTVIYFFFMGASFIFKVSFGVFLFFIALVFAFEVIVRVYYFLFRKGENFKCTNF